MMERSTFERGSLRLSVARSGAGRAMVFQHGLCADASQPAEVFPGGGGLMTLECRGHGMSDSGPLDALSLAAFTDDLTAMIDTCIGEPVVIGGISMGAALALRLAVIRPDLVRGLVLARPAWLFDAAPDNMAPNALVGALLRDHPPIGAAARFEASATAQRLAEEGPANLASLRRFFQREPIAVTGALLRRISADGPGVSANEAAAITVPTLVIGHTQDCVHPFDMAKALAASIPGARFAKITPKAADAQRHRDDFRGVLGSFLEEIPA